MKRLVYSLLLCFVLISQSIAGSYNNNWRSLPFVEMMAAMIRAMNDIMGGSGNNYYSSLYGMPYSPAFMPGMSNGLYGLNGYPMSPGNINKPPANTFFKDFSTGQNADSSNNSGNFWDLSSTRTAATSSKNRQYPANYTQSYTQNNNNSMNGIWQSQNGNVIAIYNGNHFIWSDGNKRNLAGRLAIKNNILYAYIPASKTTLQFQFYREPDKFIVRDKNARVYTFKRIY